MHETERAGLRLAEGEEAAEAIDPFAHDGQIVLQDAARARVELLAVFGLHGDARYGIGASGAIMGVLGAYVVVGLRRKLPVAPVVGLLVLNFVIGFTGDIDWRAHLGGVLIGGVLAFVYDYAGELRDQTTALVLTVGGSVAVLALLALLITSIAPGHFNLS